MVVDVMSKHIHDAEDRILTEVLENYMVIPEMHTRLTVPTSGAAPVNNVKYSPVHKIEEKKAELRALQKRDRFSVYLEQFEAEEKAMQAELDEIPEHLKAFV